MSAVALLAAAAGACGVLGGWEVLATAEAVRVAERLEAAVAPLGRARREGLAPRGGGRRRLGWLAAGPPFAARGVLRGPPLGVPPAPARPPAGGGGRGARCPPPGGCSAARCSGSPRR